MIKFSMFAAGLHTCAAIYFFFEGNFSAAVANFCAAIWAYEVTKTHE